MSKIISMFDFRNFLFENLKCSIFYVSNFSIHVYKASPIQIPPVKD